MKANTLNKCTPKNIYAGISILLVLFVSGLFLSADAAIPGKERGALITLYDSTDGDNWTDNSGWKTPPLHKDGFSRPGTERNWYGIMCNSGNTAVEKLFLHENQLSGSIPPELGDLANLQYLWLASNQLSGSITPELGSLENLNYLLLQSNELSGSIPKELGNLANLKYLMIGSNELSGSIPPELGGLTMLQDLNLSANRLFGSIPPELGDLVILKSLRFNSNMLIGEILSSLTNLANLKDANIGYNTLHTDDPDLLFFLNTVDDDWEETQTVAPKDLQAEPVDDTSIRVSWTLIPFTGYDGGYSVFYSTIPGGPYHFFGITDSKEFSEMVVTGLDPDTTYYFVVLTQTESNDNNQNTVDSEPCEEVFATTEQEGCDCDLNRDGSCNGHDWLLFYPDWGRQDCNAPGAEPCECDLNSDGSCNGLDWLIFSPDWGRTDCPHSG